MRFIVILTSIIAIAVLSCQPKKENTDTAHQHGTEQAAQPAGDTIKKSIPKEEHAMIGDAHITIKYHAPAVRGRQIWGGLVPYGDVWVTGAHRATSFEINKDFKVGDTSIPAGKYALFTIPGEKTWTFIINKKWDQHLADEYNQAEDILRFDVTPELVNHQERLKYNINQEGSTSLTIRWEKVKLAIPFTIL